MHFLAYAYLAFFVAIFSSSNAIVSISASEFIFNEKLQVAVTQSNNNNTQLTLSINRNSFFNQESLVYKICNEDRRLIINRDILDCKAKALNQIKNAFIILYIKHSQHLSRHLKQQDLLYFLKFLPAHFLYSKNANIKTVCHAGTDAIRKSLLWLMSNEHVNVVAFDHGSREDANSAAIYLNSHYSNRLQYTVGNSFEDTIPSFSYMYPNRKCDLFYISNNDIEKNEQMENNNLMISKKMDIFWAVSMLNKTNKDARIMIDGLNNKKLYMNFQSGIASNLIEMIETIEDKPSYCINIDPGLKTLNGLPNLPESCDIVKDKISKNIQVHNFTNRLAIARFPYIYDNNNNVGTNNNNNNNLDKNTNKQLRKKYSFIHPTKSGGTAVDQYLAEYYSSWISEAEWTYINGKYYEFRRSHSILASEVENPIVVVRDPYDRIVSMYLYWKYGSKMHPRDEYFINKERHTTFQDFLHRVEDEPSSLIYGATWEDHFKPTSHWIKPSDYKKSIVIVYSRNLTYCLQPLLNFIGVFNDDDDGGDENSRIIKPIPIINPSSKRKNHQKDIQWTDSLMEIVNRIYRSDFDLIDRMLNQPNQFRLVIKPTSLNKEK